MFLQLRALSFTVAMLACLSLPSFAASVTIKIKGTDGETASVVLDTDTKKWAGTNGGGGDLLRARSGIYKAGTNLTPGFAVKGTALFVGNDDTNLEAFFNNLIPEEAVVVNGDAHLLGTAKTGTWSRL